MMQHWHRILEEKMEEEKKAEKKVKNVLVVLGVPENILEVVGKGGLEYVANPLDSNENYKNRRIQFFIR